MYIALQKSDSKKKKFQSSYSSTIFFFFSYLKMLLSWKQYNIAITMATKSSGEVSFRTTQVYLQVGTRLKLIAYTIVHTEHLIKLQIP